MPVKAFRRRAFFGAAAARARTDARFAAAGAATTAREVDTAKAIVFAKKDVTC